CVCVRRTALTFAQEAPTAARRDASCRGPSPASINKPKPSDSRNAALPELPLAKIENRNAIRPPVGSSLPEKIRVRGGIVCVSRPLWLCLTGHQMQFGGF